MGFLPAASFAGFFPPIGISISFWLAATFRGFLAGFAAGATSFPALRPSASIKSTTFSPFGRSLVRIVLPARFWLMRSMKAAS